MKYAFYFVPKGVKLEVVVIDGFDESAARTIAIGKRLEQRLPSEVQTWRGIIEGTEIPDQTT